MPVSTSATSRLLQWSRQCIKHWNNCCVSKQPLNFSDIVELRVNLKSPWLTSNNLLVFGRSLCYFLTKFSPVYIKLKISIFIPFPRFFSVGGRIVSPACRESIFSFCSLQLGRTWTPNKQHFQEHSSFYSLVLQKKMGITYDEGVSMREPRRTANVSAIYKWQLFCKQNAASICDRHASTALSNHLWDKPPHWSINVMIVYIPVYSVAA